MAISGRKPKPDGTTVHRNKDAHDWTEVENVAFEGGPDLPDFRSDGRRWSDRTKQKWDTWRSMPHCTLWGPSEWDFALDSIEFAALVHDGEPKWGTELRNRERVLGTTADYLRDLRIRYVDPKQVKLAPVVSADDFRSL